MMLPPSSRFSIIGYFIESSNFGYSFIVYQYFGVQIMLLFRNYTPLITQRKKDFENIAGKGENVSIFPFFRSTCLSTPHWTYRYFTFGAIVDLL